MHRWLDAQLAEFATRRGCRINVIGPRGGAKSTVVTLAFVLQSALEGTDIAAIKSAMEKLGVESQGLGQAIYEATQAEQAAGGAPDAGAADDNVVDAEVVEDDQEKK